MPLRNFIQIPEVYLEKLLEYLISLKLISGIPQGWCRCTVLTNTLVYLGLFVVFAL